MFYTVKIKGRAYLAAALLSTAALIMLILFTVNLNAAESFSPENEIKTLVIDPGHGGLDGGAVSMNGIKESDLNLAIALKLKNIADFCGTENIMTRYDDSLSSDTKPYSELEELKHRVEIINSASGPVLISIHQNCFPTSQPRGAQVLYAVSDGSRALGELIQKNIISSLDETNRRLAQPAPEKLYITANVKCPAALVECGFMSNFADIEKLSDKNYQTGFAAILMASYLQFINDIF